MVVVVVSSFYCFFVIIAKVRQIGSGWIPSSLNVLTEGLQIKNSAETPYIAVT